jgi:hypothetical protein
MFLIDRISLADAAKILTSQLNYEPSRAMHFVQQFDKNGDGRLSTAEFDQFRKTLQETYVYFYVRHKTFETRRCKQGLASKMWPANASYRNSK